MKKGFIFNIQRFCLHDGSGIRTTVFFKGCLLACKWCSNPESQSSEAELMYLRNRCINCRKCSLHCSMGAISFGINGLILDRSLCSNCGACTSVCYSGALNMAGKTYTVEEVYGEIMRDNHYYRTSGGGVTVSGGEPLLQWEFIKELFILLKQVGVNTAVETSGFVGWDAFEHILEYTDLFLYDIKHYNAAEHMEGTKNDNKLIIENLKRLSDNHPNVIVRMPLIPGYNMNTDEILHVNSMLQKFHIKEMQLLPYHRLGKSKYESLGKPYMLDELKPPSSDELKKLMLLISKKSHCCMDYINTATNLCIRLIY